MSQYQINGKEALPPEIFYYDENSSLVNKEKDAACKSVIRSNSASFFVRKARGGGGLFNPITNKLNEKDRRHQDKFTMTKVTKAVFDKYLSFLKTKDTSLLNAATRGNKNG